MASLYEGDMKLIILPSSEALFFLDNGEEGGRHYVLLPKRAQIIEHF
jgi:hypothetical protein